MSCIFIGHLIFFVVRNENTEDVFFDPPGTRDTSLFHSTTSKAVTVPHTNGNRSFPEKPGFHPMAEKRREQ